MLTRMTAHRNTRRQRKTIFILSKCTVARSKFLCWRWQPMQTNFHFDTFERIANAKWTQRILCAVKIILFRNSSVNTGHYRNRLESSEENSLEPMLIKILRKVQKEMEIIKPQQQNHVILRND